VTGKTGDPYGYRDAASRAAFEQRHATLRAVPAIPPLRAEDYVTLRGFGCVPGTAPDGYAASGASEARESLELEPSMDPAYRPKGTPPDGHMLALAARALETNESIEFAPELPSNARATPS
jgi:hypothetical protein